MAKPSWCRSRKKKKEKERDCCSAKTVHSIQSQFSEKIHKLETGIINLDNSTRGGSHWICYRNVDKQYCGYFDPFGLIMPNEIKNYLKTSGKIIVFSSDEIQERDRSQIWLKCNSSNGTRVTDTFSWY